MPASLKEVAARARVSVGTVSNVLNRPDRVRPEAVARVNAAIAALGYVPNGAARQLRAGQSTSIALVVLDVSNPFFTDLARGAERRAEELGLSVFLANSDESAAREERHLDFFETQRVFGLLISPVGEDQSRLHRLRARGIPVVLVDRSAPDDRFSSVSVDDFVGGKIAAQHLLERGRRNLAFVGGPLRIQQVADRYRGASETVNAVPGASLRYIETGALTLDEGRRAGAEIHRNLKDSAIDAVFAANDLLAIGIQQALIGGDPPVSIPGDIALVGYDDISFAAGAVVPITSVRQPSEIIGSTAVDLLLEEHSLAADGARSQVVFQPELVVRASTGGDRPL